MEAVWRLITFLLEGVVFLLVGLQLRSIGNSIETDVGATVAVTAAVIGTVVLVRFAWMYPATYLARLIPRVRRREERPPWTVPTVIAWAGMRGVVTLAAAQTLDDKYTSAFKDLFIFVAFAVIVFTLLLQGTTLPWLAVRLGVRQDTTSADALAEAGVQHQASRAALAAHQEGDVAPGLGQTPAEIAADRAGPEHQETHINHPELSLRAKRSNLDPQGASSTRLLRRFAPRNDSGFSYSRCSIVSALEAPYSPEGSTFSSLTTPSSTIIE